MAEEQEGQVTNEPEYSPVELKAMEQGWKPQDQWEGNPDDWRPAKEFVDRGELFKKIDDLKRDNKALRQGQEELMKHYNQVHQAAYAEALAALKAKKKEAYEQGDIDAVVEIDEKIDETKEAQRAAKEAAVERASEPDPVFSDWVSRNAWYTSDSVMKGAADEVARQAFAKYGADKERILEAVDEAIRKAFPNKFENPKRSAPSAVEGSTNKKSNQRDSLEVEMTDAERQIMNKILRVTPGMTKEKYLEGFKAVKSRRGVN